jgi:Tetratricopeptide repeat
MDVRKKFQSSHVKATKALPCLLAALVLAVASPARGNDSATEQARQHYEIGTRQYDLGHWDDAIREFEKAYELRPDPNFLYNMAQAYRRKGDPKRALDLYRNYLIKTPKSPLRPEIEERIKSLQKQIDDAASAAPVQPALEPTVPPPAPIPALLPGPADVSPPAETPAMSSPPAEPALPAGAPPAAIPPTDQPSQVAPATYGTTSAAVLSAADSPPPTAPGRKLRIAGIVCGSVGVAAIVTGVVFGLLARDLSNKVANAKSFNQSDDAAGLQDQKLQWDFYLVGAAAAAVGATLYYFGRRAARTATPTVSLSPVVGPGTAGVSAMGVF